MSHAFDAPQYLVRRKILSFLSPKFHVYDGAGQLVLFAKQKAFKLKEDLRLYSDESMSTEVLAIRTGQILDFSGVYQVLDARTGGPIGGLKRHGLKSMLRDEWTILDAGGREVGKIREESTSLAILRRFLGGPVLQVIAPQSFVVELLGRPVGTMSQNRNPFLQTLTLDLSGDPGRQLDRRIAIAAGVLLTAIEGRQQS